MEPGSELVGGARACLPTASLAPKLLLWQGPEAGLWPEAASAPTALPGEYERPGTATFSNCKVGFPRNGTEGKGRLWDRKTSLGVGPAGHPLTCTGVAPTPPATCSGPCGRDLLTDAIVAHIGVTVVTLLPGLQNPIPTGATMFCGVIHRVEWRQLAKERQG